MKRFLDTSVLVPVFYGDHQHHDSSLALFVSCDQTSSCCGAHSLAEVFATLTRLLGRYRISAVLRLVLRHVPGERQHAGCVVHARRMPVGAAGGSQRQSHRRV